MRVLVVGGMNMDILGSPNGALVPRDSTPGRITARPGGVGRNIAARLSELGVRVSLATAISRDAFGGALRSDCETRGIALDCALTVNTPTPMYMAIHDESGDMAQGINDMRAIDALTADWARALPDDFDLCVADANLREDTLRALCARNTRVLIDPVSAAKCTRVRSVLPLCAAIKPNQIEAEALTGERDPLTAARALITMGARRAFVSLGADGLCYADERDYGHIATTPVHAAATGAGDALCAGLALALLTHKSTRACAQQGVQTAYEYLLAQAKQPL